MNTKIQWLPTGYTVPKSQSAYTKIKDGENKIRILSRPITGWEDWENNKPIRFTEDKKPKAAIDPKKPIKHFMAFIIWNYSEEQIQIYQVTQATIKNAIIGLCCDEDWGTPCFYDIKINRTGQQKDTEYTVNPVPHKPISDQVLKAFKEKPICLEALYHGLDPFSADPEHRTKGLFEIQEVLSETKKTIVDMPGNPQVIKASTDHVVSLMEILEECPDDYKKSLNEFLETHKIKTMHDIPQELCGKLIVRSKTAREKHLREKQFEEVSNEAAG